MRFLCLAYGRETDWNALSHREQERLLAQDEVLRRRGDLVAPVRTRITTVRAWNGSPETTDAPVADPALPLAGFSLIEAGDVEEVVRLVADTPCARAKGAIEIRELHEAASPSRGREMNGTAEALQALDVFVGTWHAEGTSYAEGQRADDPRASAVPWISDESYEWLPGERFLLHRWDAVVGTRPFNGIEVIGYDRTRGAYFARFFDNAGNHPDYRVFVDGNVWRFSEPETRASVTIAGDRRTMAWMWEWRNGGSRWLPLCDRVARRTDLGTHSGASLASQQHV